MVRRSGCSDVTGAVHSRPHDVAHGASMLVAPFLSSTVAVQLALVSPCYDTRPARRGITIEIGDVRPEPTGSAGQLAREGDPPSVPDRSGRQSSAPSPPFRLFTPFWTCAQLKSKQAHDVTTCWGGDGIPLVILSVWGSFQQCLCLLHSSSGRVCTNSTRRSLFELLSRPLQRCT